MHSFEDIDIIRVYMVLKALILRKLSLLFVQIKSNYLRTIHMKMTLIQLDKYHMEPLPRAGSGMGHARRVNRTWLTPALRGPVWWGRHTHKPEVTRWHPQAEFSLEECFI